MLYRAPWLQPFEILFSTHVHIKASAYRLSVSYNSSISHTFIAVASHIIVCKSDIRIPQLCQGNKHRLIGYNMDANTILLNGIL